MTKRVTMADIARVAGVHKTTVSMALRNHSNLPSHTIERIKKIAEEMDYRPDPNLSALNKYRHSKEEAAPSATLAFLTSWQSEFGWRELSAHNDFYLGARKEARKQGFSLDHFWVKHHANPEHLSRVMISRGIRGVILSSFFPERHCMDGFKWDRFSAIRIDYFPREISIHSVSNDQQAIAQLAFRKVIEAGYRRVGVIIPEPWDEYVDRAWSIGVLAVQQTLNREDCIPPLFYDYRRPGLKENSLLPVPAGELKGWIEQYKPDSIVSYGPVCLPSLYEIGLKPGRDIGFADMFKDEDDKSVAGVVHQCQQVGRLAVEFVVRKIQQNITGLPTHPSKTLVDGTWMDGESLTCRVS